MRSDDLRHGLVVAVRYTPVSPQCPKQPFAILDRQRAVEAQLLGEAIQVGMRHFPAGGELGKRPAGSQMQDGEANDRYNQQQDYRLHQSADEKRSHGHTRESQHRAGQVQYHSPMSQQFWRWLMFGRKPASPSLMPSIGAYWKIGRMGSSSRTISCNFR